ncbi:MAG TPA: glucan ABC transporter ATP-binding protein/ permease [Polyangiales bacterium]|nr:glucan ABC transporter ATP-binding protein/ permease [Polyangiales bacterium]
MSMLRTYARVLGQLRTRRKLAFWLLLGNLVLAIARFAEPLLFGRVVDALAHPARPLGFVQLLPLIGAWLGFGLVGIVGGVSVAFHADVLSHRLRLSVIAHYFEHVLSLPLGFHLNAHSGRLMKIMTSGAEAMWMLWLGFFREHCSALVSLCVLLPLTVFLNVWLGALLCALVFGFALLIGLVVHKTEDAQSHVGKFHTRLAEHTSDALGNLPVIQSFTRVQAELGSLRTISQQLLDAQLPVLSFWAITSIASRAAATLTVCIVLTAGTYLILHGELTLGELVTFISLATMLIGRLDATLTFIAALFQESSKLQDFFEVLDTEPSVRDAPDARVAGAFAGEVVFDDVSFSYDGKRNAVEGVSFVARAGETVALVGATGSGKSTTLSLLYRAFDPSSGHIRIDGHDIRHYTLDSLRHNIAIVFQEPMLFARSVRENLLLGRPDAGDAELREALARAQALEVVEALPEGLATLLSERGRSLSGGERQRLSIARALLKAPPILVLDEPTAALDAGTEHKLKVALEEVMRERTTFVIAHRLATIRGATRILVFDQGRIVESGSYDELVAQGGRFAALARAQFMAAS